MERVTGIEPALSAWEAAHRSWSVRVSPQVNGLDMRTRALPRTTPCQIRARGADAAAIAALPSGPLRQDRRAIEE